MASQYLGIDAAQSHMEQRNVRVGDAFTELARLNLTDWNCIDIDAWGSPFRYVRAVVSAKRLARGERLALVVTDGSSKKRLFAGHGGRHDHWITAGMPIIATPRTASAVTIAGLRAAARIMDARIVAMRRHTSARGAHGSVAMIYAAAILEGRQR